MPGSPGGLPDTGASRHRRRVAAVLVAVALLAGCGGPAGRQAQPPPPTTAPSGPAAAEATSGAMTIGLPSAPTNWNPLAATTPAPAGAAAPDPVVQTVADAVLPSAFVVRPNLTATINPQLLASAKVVSRDPLTIHYTINPGAAWSDGTPVTAADFVYTWEADSGQRRFRDVGGAAYTPASTAGYDHVVSVAAGAGGPSTVAVTFAGPYPDWRALFSPLLPAHIGRSVGFDHGFADPVTDLPSAGPFLVQSYVPGWRVVLVRNPGWWGPGSELSSITIDFVTEASVAAQSLLAGQLDAAELAFTPGAAKTLRATDGLTVSTTGPGIYDDLVLDERTPLMASAVVRRAILMAVDRSALAEIVGTRGAPGTAPVDNRAFLPGAAGYRDDSGALGRGGLAAARSLLASAGFQRAGATLETGAGTPVTVSLVVATSSPLTSLEATAVASACRSLGMGVMETPAAAAASGAMLRGRGWDLAIVPRAVSPFPSSLTAEFASGAAGNLAGYSSPAMDALLATVDTLRDGPARTAAVDRVDALAWKDAVDLPLLFQPQLFVTQSRYLGVAAAPGPNGPAWNVARWGLPAGT